MSSAKNPTAEPMSLRFRFEELLLRSVRAYTANTPIKKGKYRLASLAMTLCRESHRSMPVQVRDGRRFIADLTTGMQEGVYFIGEYEPALSAITSKLIDPGDVCIDVGANFGWYTTLMAQLVGDDGAVHAFEPLPDVFSELQRTVELAGEPRNIIINNAALADGEGRATMHLFRGQPTGHASMSGGRSSDNITVDCRMQRLDDYLLSNDVGRVDFIKVDIEGAELAFLRGAKSVFEQNEPPIILMEMAKQTSSSFGYKPDDLVKLIRDSGEYAFYAVDEPETLVREIDGFSDDDIGANVFCVPVGSPRRQRILEFYRR